MELLAHIGAPTSKKDDDRYKAQFAAYLQFKPEKAHSFSPRDIQVPATTTPLPRHRSPQHPSNTPGSVDPNPVSKSVFQQLEDARIYSSLCSTCGRPTKRQRLTPEFSIGNESFHSFSTVQSSEDANATLCIPATYPPKAQKTPSPASPPSLLPHSYSLSNSSSSATRPPAPNITSGPFNGTRSDQCVNNPSPRATESTAPNTTLGIGSYDVTIDHGTMMHLRPTPLGPLVPSSVTNAEANLPQADANKPNTSTQPGNNPTSSKPLPNSSAPMSSPTSSQLEQLALLPSEIWPLPPKADSLDWNKTKSHITPKLLALAREIDPSKRYKPISQTCTPHPWERGYWHFDTSSWSVGLQLKFWDFLGEAIKRGSAGYATWCEVSAKRAPDGSITGLGEVKVWCWGDEVMHIYLLLYTASIRRVAKIGACWKSGRGEAVVRMRDERENE